MSVLCIVTQSSMRLVFGPVFFYFLDIWKANNCLYCRLGRWWTVSYINVDTFSADHFETSSESFEEDQPEEPIEEHNATDNGSTSEEDESADDECTEDSFTFELPYFCSVPFRAKAVNVFFLRLPTSNLCTFAQFGNIHFYHCRCTAAHCRSLTHFFSRFPRLHNQHMWGWRKRRRKSTSRNWKASLLYSLGRTVPARRSRWMRVSRKMATTTATLRSRPMTPVRLAITVWRKERRESIRERIIRREEEGEKGEGVGGGGGGERGRGGWWNAEGLRCGPLQRMHKWLADTGVNMSTHISLIQTVRWNIEKTS